MTVSSYGIGIAVLGTVQVFDMSETEKPPEDCVLGAVLDAAKVSVRVFVLTSRGGVHTVFDSTSSGWGGLLPYSIDSIAAAGVGRLLRYGSLHCALLTCLCLLL